MLMNDQVQRDADRQLVVSLLAVDGMTLQYKRGDHL